MSETILSMCNKERVNELYDYLIGSDRDKGIFLLPWIGKPQDIICTEYASTNHIIIDVKTEYGWFTLLCLDNECTPYQKVEVIEEVEQPKKSKKKQRTKSKRQKEDKTEELVKDSLIKKLLDE